MNKGVYRAFYCIWGDYIFLDFIRWDEIPLKSHGIRFAESDGIKKGYRYNRKVKPLSHKFPPGVLWDIMCCVVEGKWFGSGRSGGSILMGWGSMVCGGCGGCLLWGVGSDEIAVDDPLSDSSVLFRGNLVLGWLCWVNCRDVVLHMA